jgi:hypothetical protein
MANPHPCERTRFKRGHSGFKKRGQKNYRRLREVTKHMPPAELEAALRRIREGDCLLPTEAMLLVQEVARGRGDLQLMLAAANALGPYRAPRLSAASLSVGQNADLEGRTEEELVREIEELRARVENSRRRLPAGRIIDASVVVDVAPAAPEPLEPIPESQPEPAPPALEPPALEPLAPLALEPLAPQPRAPSHEPAAPAEFVSAKETIAPTPPPAPAQPVRVLPEIPAVKLPRRSIGF